MTKLGLFYPCLFLLLFILSLTQMCTVKWIVFYVEIFAFDNICDLDILELTIICVSIMIKSVYFDIFACGNYRAIAINEKLAKMTTLLKVLPF